MKESLISLDFYHNSKYKKLEKMVKEVAELVAEKNLKSKLTEEDKIMLQNEMEKYAK